ncbi:ATP-binding cassette domain-containing protein [Allocoprobacillus halotolerans]|uniref:ATP-binding cassette domain-containing protein n=1 Tax=Allocoprobacillus halotolerans TaxID=2944914 RepID=A0ABY5HZP2_9FIRM|nr:ATP-binding cassette domain-containing protein [Allocoprobacillus halotolerans]UTY38499.1 ATP-binding cassette domain-containing protein [Allocoprobacillus halotolerans]
MIHIKNIQLSFPSKVLIESGNMEIPYGQITGIIGESGTGKTALLQEIGLLKKDCSFDYVFDDMHLHEYDDNQRAMVRCQNISFIYQEVCFFQKMSLRENIEFFAMLAHKSLTEEDIYKLLDMVHLDFDLSTSIETLSGGEKQRLAILCGLIREADLFIFDEPTSYLDATNTAIIIELLKDLAYQKKK